MFASYARRERDERFWYAIIACSNGGGNPWEMIGEPRPDAGSGGEGWGGGGVDAASVKSLKLRAGRESEQRWRVAVGLAPDDDVPEVLP